MWSRIKELIIKEFIQISRDKRMLLLVFAVPIIQLLLFGYAITTDIKNIPTAVLNMDKSSYSRDLIQAFENSGKFNINLMIDSENAIPEVLDKGKAETVIKIGPDFEKDLKSGKQAKIQVVIDGSDSNSAAMIMSYAGQICFNFSRTILVERMERIKVLKGRDSGSTLDLFSNEIRVWYNPALKSRVSNVPAVMAFILLISTMMLTSMSIVKERESGTIEQLIVTPIKPIELVIGKTMPFAIIGFIDVVLVLAVSYSWFKIPLTGNLLILFLAMVLYLLTTLGVGLFISPISRTQQQAMMSTFFFTMPAILLSGFMFPIENMPSAIQYLTYINPIRYFYVIIVSIFLKGAGLNILWDEMLALGALGVFILIISIVRFNKRLE